MVIASFGQMGFATVARCDITFLNDWATVEEFRNLCDEHQGFTSRTRTRSKPGIKELAELERPQPLATQPFEMLTQTRVLHLPTGSSQA